MFRGYPLDLITRMRTDELNNKDEFPRMYKVLQFFPPRGLPDPGLAVEAALASSALDQKLRPGMTVGITAGSRGIRNIVTILRKTADYVKSLGCRPVLIAAMGSHGGGSPEGQRELLSSLGSRKTAQGRLCSARRTAL